MNTTGYKTKSLAQNVPPQLVEDTKSHDVILSRDNVRHFPTGSDSASPNGYIRFELTSNSQWMDLKTAHLVLDISAGATCKVVKSSLKNIIDGVEINIKGQSVQDTLQSANLSVWTDMKERLYKSLDEFNSNAVIYGANAGASAANTNSNAYVNQGKYTVALPLSEIVDFFAMNRSYLPLMALPITLNFRLAPTAKVFCGSGSGDYAVSKSYISADMLTMDQKIEEAFRKSVSDGVVSFVYPNCFHMLKSAPNASDSIKFNVGTQNADALFVVPVLTPATDNLSPLQSAEYIKSDTTLQFFVDSRAILSQPIDSVAQRMLELQKAVLNVNNRYNDGFILFGSSQLDGTTTSTPSSFVYGDVPYKVAGVNLARQMDENSYSGMNLALTGGNIIVQVTGGNVVANTELHMFVKTKSVLELTENFIQVIR